MPNQFRLSHAFPSTPPSSTPPPSVPPSLPGSENGDEDGPEEATFDENAPPVIRDGSREDPSDEESQTLESSTATPVPPTPAPSQPSFPLTRHSLTVLARLSWRQWHRRVWSCLVDVRAVLVVSAHGVITQALATLTKAAGPHTSAQRGPYRSDQIQSLKGTHPVLRAVPFICVHCIPAENPRFSSRAPNPVLAYVSSPAQGSAVRPTPTGGPLSVARASVSHPGVDQTTTTRHHDVAGGRDPTAICATSHSCQGRPSGSLPRDALCTNGRRSRYTKTCRRRY